MCCLLHCFIPLGKGNTSKSNGVAEELEEQINAGAIGWVIIVNKELASTWKDISEIKSYVYGKWQTSDSSWEFLRIENKQMNAVQNNS